jgi:hypothetical protein
LEEAAMTTPDDAHEGGEEEPVNADELDAAEQDIKPPSDPSEQPSLKGFDS